MHQSAVYALSERMSAPGMSHPASGRIAVMSNPDMSGHVIEAVEANHILGVADDLEDEKVPAVAQYECVCPSVLGVELHVQRMGGVKHELLGSSLPVVRVDDIVQLVRDEIVESIIARPDEVAYDIGRARVEGREVFLPTR